MGAIDIACLEDQIRFGHLKSYASEPVKKYQEIFKSSYSPQLKLQAFTHLALALHKTEIHDNEQYITNEVQNFLAHVGDCSLSLGYCDQLLQMLYAVTPIIPQTIHPIIENQKGKINSWPFTVILKQAFQLKAEAIEATANFYSNTLIDSIGTTPQWNKTFSKTNRDKLDQNISALGGQLIDSSQLWPAEDMLQFLPTEMQVELAPVFKEKGDDKVVQALSHNLNENMRSIGQNLKALALYSQRLNQKDPTKWLETNLALAKQNEFQSLTFFVLLMTFIDNELRLPFRTRWIETIKALPHQDEKQVQGLVKYAQAQLDAINKFLDLASEKLNLQDLVYYEQYVATWNYSFHSAFKSFHELLGDLTSAGSISQTYLESSTKQNLALLQDKMYAVEESWAIHKCFSIVPNQDFQHRNRIGFIKPVATLPLTKVPFNLEGCGEDVRDTDSTARKAYTVQVTNREIAQPLIQLGIQSALLLITLVSAGLATPIATAATTQIVSASAEAGASTVARILATKAAEKVIHAMIGAFIFSATMKVMTAMVGLAPIWDSQKGIWGNFGKPWLIGSAIFFCLPFTSALGQKLAASLAIKMGSQKLADLVAFTVETGMDTTVFVSIDYIHRLIEKVSTPTQPLSRGDTGEMWLSSGLYSLAFRASAILEEAGFFTFNAKQVNQEIKNINGAK